MAVSRRGFLAGCLSAGALSLAGCGSTPPLHRQRWYLFGTLVDVTLAHPDAARVALAMRELSALLRDLHHNLHAWKPGRLMEVNNAIARGESTVVSPGMQALVSDLQDYHRRSGGIFNPALGELIALWGFHDDLMPSGAPPARQRIDRLLAEAPSPLDLQLQDGVLSSRNPHVQLDLGGYGKGYALDAGMRVLQGLGIHDAILNAGGDLNAAGSRYGRAWRVGIRHPQGRGALAWLETAGSEAVYTSGDYERYREYDGQRYAHIIDPRNGMPVQDIVSATVIHRDGARADAAATALSVAGSAHWQAVAEALDMSQVMVVNRTGRIEVTRAMAQRLTPGELGGRQLVVV